MMLAWRNGGMTMAEGRTMAKKKADTSKKTGKDVPSQGVILVYKADAQTATAIKEWLAGLADHVGAGHGHDRHGVEGIRRGPRLQADAQAAGPLTADRPRPDVRQGLIARVREAAKPEPQSHLQVVHLALCPR